MKTRTLIMHWRGQCSAGLLDPSDRRPRSYSNLSSLRNYPRDDLKKKRQRVGTSANQNDQFRVQQETMLIQSTMLTLGADFIQLAHERGACLTCDSEGANSIEGFVGFVQSSDVNKHSPHEKKNTEYLSNTGLRNYSSKQSMTDKLTNADASNALDGATASSAELGIDEINFSDRRYVSVDGHDSNPQKLAVLVPDVVTSDNDTDIDADMMFGQTPPRADYSRILHVIAATFRNSKTVPPEQSTRKKPLKGCLKASQPSVKAPTTGPREGLQIDTVVRNSAQSDSSCTTGIGQSSGIKIGEDVSITKESTKPPARNTTPKVSWACPLVTVRQYPRDPFQHIDLSKVDTSSYKPQGSLNKIGVQSNSHARAEKVPYDGNEYFDYIPGGPVKSVDDIIREIMQNPSRIALGLDPANWSLTGAVIGPDACSSEKVSFASMDVLGIDYQGRTCAYKTRVDPLSPVVKTRLDFLFTGIPFLRQIGECAEEVPEPRVVSEESLNTRKRIEFQRSLTKPKTFLGFPVKQKNPMQRPQTLLEPLQEPTEVTPHESPLVSVSITDVQNDPGGQTIIIEADSVIENSSGTAAVSTSKTAVSQVTTCSENSERVMSKKVVGAVGDSAVLKMGASSRSSSKNYRGKRLKDGQQGVKAEVQAEIGTEDDAAGISTDKQEPLACVLRPAGPSNRLTKSAAIQIPTDGIRNIATLHTPSLRPSRRRRSQVHKDALAVEINKPPNGHSSPNKRHRRQRSADASNANTKPNRISEETVQESIDIQHSVNGMEKCVDEPKRHKKRRRPARRRRTSESLKSTDSIQDRRETRDTKTQHIPPEVHTNVSTRGIDLLCGDQLQTKASPMSRIARVQIVRDTVHPNSRKKDSRITRNGSDKCRRPTMFSKTLMKDDQVKQPRTRNLGQKNLSQEPGDLAVRQNRIKLSQTSRNIQPGHTKKTAPHPCNAGKQKHGSRTGKKGGIPMPGISSSNSRQYDQTSLSNQILRRNVSTMRTEFRGDTFLRSSYLPLTEMHSVFPILGTSR